MMPPPIPPLPPREFFQSDADYARAKMRRNAVLKRQKDANKWCMAVALTVLGVCAIGMTGVLFIGLWSAFGWRGPLGLLAIAGLFWAAAVEVHKRL